MNKHDLPAADFDANIKRIIEVLHEFLMRYFFPSLSERLIFPEKAPSRDKELQKISADEDKKGTTTGDKLLGYFTTDGKEQLVLIHIEAHSGDETHFKEQQFKRYYRLRDANPLAQITQLVLYIGDTVPPRPNRHRESFEGTVNIHRFNAYIVKKQDRKKLLEDAKTNPMALVILALLENVKTRNQAEHRRKTKLRLMRLCVESGFRKDFTLALLSFVQYTITLPEKEAVLFQEEVEQILYPKMKSLVEQYPDDWFLVGMQRIFLNGKTYAEMLAEDVKERDKQKEKELILSLFYTGVEIKAIAVAFKKDVKYIEEVILESKKQAGNGTSS